MSFIFFLVIMAIVIGAAFLPHAFFGDVGLSPWTILAYGLLWPAVLCVIYWLPKVHRSYGAENLGYIAYTIAFLTIPGWILGCFILAGKAMMQKRRP